MDATAVRGGGKGSTKEYGLPYILSTGSWRLQKWCAKSWDVDLLLMLPEGLILDQGLVLFGFSLFTATIPSQIHLSVLMVVFISTLKTIIVPFLTTRMLEQSAQDSCV